MAGAERLLLAMNQGEGTQEPVLLGSVMVQLAQPPALPPFGGTSCPSELVTRFQINGDVGLVWSPSGWSSDLGVLCLFHGGSPTIVTAP